MLSEQQQPQQRGAGRSETDPATSNTAVPIARSFHWLDWQEEVLEEGESKEERITKSQNRANSYYFKTAIICLAHATTGQWGHLRAEDISVERMTTALNNVVLKVVVDDGDDGRGGDDKAISADSAPLPRRESGTVKALVIKIHGFTDVALKELRWLRMLSSSQSTSYAPALLAEFGNGHIEECIDGSSLSASEMRDVGIACNVMQAMSSLHSLFNEIGGGENDLFRRVERWRQRAEGCENSKDFQRYVSAEYCKQIVGQCSQIRSPLVLGHNDLQMGNILRNGRTGKITLVDYEYSNIAPRGFDLANYFCEWMADYSDASNPAALDSRHFPSQETMRRLCAAYLGYSDDGYHAVGEQRDNVESLMCEISPFFPLSHLLWTLWGIYQSNCSSIEFDYIGYARARASFLDKQFSATRHE